MQLYEKSFLSTHPLTNTTALEVIDLATSINICAAAELLSYNGNDEGNQ